MNSIFASILKNKKATLSLVLVSIAIGVLIPLMPSNIALAQKWIPRTYKNCYDAFKGEVTNPAFWGCVVYINSTNSATTIAEIAFSEDPLLVSVGRAIIDSFRELAYGFSSFCAYIFDIVTNTLVKDSTGKWAITNAENSFLAPAFIRAWNAVKNWANMLIVLGFIGVGLAFILSLDQYKKLLVPLLITALLINFSIVFVGIAIDISNVAMLSFLGPTSVSNFGDSIVTEIANIWNAQSIRPKNGTELLSYAQASSGFILMHIIVGGVLLMLAMTYIIRYAMLVILFILSPLAFALRIFPFSGAKKAWEKWIHMFTKWCLAGLIATFFLRLGLDVVSNYQSPLFDPTAQVNVLQILAERVVPIWIALFFMIIGAYLAVKSSALANLVMSAAAAITMAIITGGTSLLGTVGGGALKIAGQKTGVTGAVKATRDWFGGKTDNMRNKFHEWATGQKGYADLKKQEKFKNFSDNEKRIDMLSKQERMGILTSRKRMMSDDETKDRLAAVNLSLKDGSFSGLKRGQKEEIVRWVREKAGGAISMSDFTKASPSVAHLDTEKFREVRAKNPTWTSDQVKSELIGRAQKKANLKDLGEEEFTMQLVENTTDKKLSYAYRDLPKNITDKLEGIMKDAIREKDSAYKAAAAARAAGSTALVKTHEAIEERFKTVAERIQKAQK